MNRSSLEFGPSCSEGMVLQHGTRAVLWGWSDPGLRHVFTVAGISAEAVSGADGRWTAVWTGLPPGGPHSMAHNGEVLFQEVWIGDLWLCAGQSNMERSLEACAPWPSDALLYRGDPGIRQLCLPNQFDFQNPRDRIPGARWIGADTAEVVKISAAAFHFARELRTRTRIPQGLVLTAVGGSTAQAWLPAEALEAFPGQAAEAAQFAVPGWLAGLQNEEERRRHQWFADLEALDPPDPTRAGQGEWRKVVMPGWAEDGGAGSAWFRKRLDLAQAGDGSGRLSLGTLVDSDEVWVNGTKVGSTAYQYPTRRYPVPPGLLREGSNEIVIRLVAPRGGPGATPGKPWSLVGAGGSIDLAGDWECRPGASAPELPADTFLPLISLGLYNGMLAALAPLSFRAVLWYQGESNLTASREYEPLMKALLSRWRRLFQQPELPFVLVQLPLYGKAEAFRADEGWAWVRDAQRRLASLPGTALAVALDAGEENDIHPADKETVGHRLALAARKLVLGEPLETWTGPLFHGWEKQGRAVRLRFSQTGAGLQTSDGRAPKSFFLAGPDGRFLPAEAVLENEAVVVQSSGVDPVEVRYAWASNPAGANLVNSLGIPAAPFRGP